MAKPIRYITKKCTTCNVCTSALSSVEDQAAIQRHLGWPSTEPPAPSGLVMTEGMYIACRGGCGKMRRAYPVKGTFSTVHKCSARCLASTGFVCDCSCAGANHGANSSAL